MPDLTPVGLSKDGSRLVLRSDSGSEFTVVVDHRFRAALRGDEVRLAQLEVSMDSALRPRDIQARIRSGQSPETVAAAAGTTVDRISAFAAPVLAERAHVADRAQRATVRRRGGDGTVGQLGDTVAQRLRDRDVRPETVEWDAWRRDDGRWTVVADYHLDEAERRAEFVYDAAGRYVVAADEESRALVGEADASARPPAAEGHGAAESLARRELSEPAADEHQPALGADAIELVTGGPVERPADGPSSDEPATDLTEAVAAVRALASEPAAQPPERREVPPVDDELALAPLADPAGPDEPTGSADPAASTEPSLRSRRPARRSRKGRAAVPSWDEIMFGSGGGD